VKLKGEKRWIGLPHSRVVTTASSRLPAPLCASQDVDDPSNPFARPHLVLVESTLPVTRSSHPVYSAKFKSKLLHVCCNVRHRGPGLSILYATDDDTTSSLAFPIHQLLSHGTCGEDSRLKRVRDGI